MDLPRSGWYPDPYGAPDLLRWWDGSTWTHHTHPGVGTADTTGGGGVAASGAQQSSAQSASVQSTTVQPVSGQPVSGRPVSGRPVSGRPAGGGWATRERVIGDWAGGDWGTGDQLAATQPPKGPRTEPQPALPVTSVQSAVQSAVQPTAYQPAVQPTRHQPAVQPTAYQPMAGGADGGGTQVLFLSGDAWQVPGAPGAPGGPAAPNRYGYQQAQRRRRMWLMSGLVAGTAVAVAVIAVIATSLAKSPGGTTADQAAITPPASPTSSAAAPSPTPPPTPTPPVSMSASAAPPAAVLSDGQSGLSYSQLATPWQPNCPSNLNSAFSWTAGESAIAGQVNGGQTTWNGEACSGPLPAQYNYSGVNDLDNTATTVAQNLENAYYNTLTHTSQPVLSEPISVSGHAGWEIEYQINYTDATQGETWTTEEAAVVVADTGTGNTPVVFFTSIPANLGESNVGSLVTSLQLTVVPNANSGSPGADGGGSPTANAGGNP